VQLPATFNCSSVTGDSRAELLGLIDETLAAIHSQENQLPDAPEETAKPALPKTRKRGPDLNRPW
jgi:hypothetical protein